MNRLFTDNGWKDYTYWQTEDRKTLKKINQLIDDICRNGNEGIRKPEPLTGTLSGYWSRRISDKDRLIYKIDADNVYLYWPADTITAIYDFCVAAFGTCIMKRKTAPSDYLQFPASTRSRYESREATFPHFRNPVPTRF